MTLAPPPDPHDAIVNTLDIVLEDLDNISDKRCDSVMSVASVTNSTISPRQRKSSHQRGSQVSIETKARKRSSGPGLATKRAELLSDKRIVPNKNVGSKLKVSLFSVHLYCLAKVLVNYVLLWLCKL